MTLRSTFCRKCQPLNWIEGVLNKIYQAQHNDVACDLSGILIYACTLYKPNNKDRLDKNNNNDISHTHVSKLHTVYSCLQGFIQFLCR